MSEKKKVEEQEKTTVETEDTKGDNTVSDVNKQTVDTKETKPEEKEAVQEKKTEEKLLTQEEVDEIISKRLAREREKLAEKYQDYDSLKEKAEQKEEIETEYSGLKEKYSSTEKERDTLKIALEYGFDEDALALVSGESYDELKESADKLKKVIGNQASSRLSRSKQYDKDNDEPKSTGNKWVDMARNAVRRED